MLSKWNSLLLKLDEEDKGKVMRSMGLKIEQLKVVSCFEKTLELPIQDCRLDIIPTKLEGIMTL